MSGQQQDKLQQRARKIPQDSSKRARPDIQPVIAFLCTRVKNPTTQANFFSLVDQVESFLPVRKRATPSRVVGIRHRRRESLYCLLSTTAVECVMFVLSVSLSFPEPHTKAQHHSASSFLVRNNICGIARLFRFGYRCCTVVKFAVVTKKEREVSPQ